MAGFLRADKNESVFSGSPTNLFLADEVASICPLITPSPPTNALVNPLPEANEEDYQISEELATKLQQVQEGEKNGLTDSVCQDSASSSSSAIAEPPVCTQLLNHRTVYHPYTDEETAVEAQETVGKVQPLQLTFRNPPDNYFFMSWNWPLIRKVSLYTFLAGVCGMVALVIAMIINLPKTCNPPTKWYQGTVMYEIFPSSYHDPNQTTVTNFERIKDNADYLKRLGIRAVRLNSIFETEDYPKNYNNTATLKIIAHQLGTLDDLRHLVVKFKEQNISVILDLPIWPVVKQLVDKDVTYDNETNSDRELEFLTVEPVDIVEEALRHWTSVGIEGFYLKGLENFVDDPYFMQSIKRWKKILGPESILIINELVIHQSEESFIDDVLKNVDLIDIRLEIDLGASGIQRQMENLQNGTLFSKPYIPWIHWSLGDQSTVRLANRLAYANGTLGAIILQLMLPGTPSILYGDEVGLQETYHSQNSNTEDFHFSQNLLSSAWTQKQNEIFSWVKGKNDDSNFEQISAIGNMTKLRASSPSIYANSVCRKGHEESKSNAEIKYSRENLLVIQRWYPRRKPYVVVSNFGKNQIEEDLSLLLYSGLTKVGPRPNSKAESIVFKKFSLWPGESVVIELD